MRFVELELPSASAKVGGEVMSSLDDRASFPASLCGWEMLCCSPEMLCCSPEMLCCSPEMLCWSPEMLCWSPEVLCWSPEKV